MVAHDALPELDWGTYRISAKDKGRAATSCGEARRGRSDMLTRRQALLSTFLGGAAACAPANEQTSHRAAEMAATGLFTCGVASGDPGHDSVIIWTRLEPTALPQPPDEFVVTWELSDDEAFASIRARGEVSTGASRDWTVKALATDLSPGVRYFYRFTAAGETSPVGRTRTVAIGKIDSARFAVVSCANYPSGYFNVYDLISKRDDFDAVIHLGDYLYEYGVDGFDGETGRALNRNHEPAHEVVTLADYRRRHQQYKSDPSLMALHAAHPLIAIWDDHETANDSWHGGAENHDPEIEGDWDARKRAALQAYYEWMPIRDPQPGALKEAIFKEYSYGDLLTIAAIETRLLARSRPLHYDEVVSGLTDSAAVAKFREEVLWSREREMLGEEQSDFLASSLSRSVNEGQPWQIIANQIIMAEVIAPDLSPHVTEDDIAELERVWNQARAFVQFSTLGLPTNLDAWDGYPAARERFYDLAKGAGVNGLLVLTGDTHTWWANELRRRDGTQMGVELGVSSVTSPSPYRPEFLDGKGAEYALLTNQENKDVRFLSGDSHGFIDLEVKRKHATASFIAVDTIAGPDYHAMRRARFEITRTAKGVRFAGAQDVSLKEQALFMGLGG